MKTNKTDHTHPQSSLANPSTFWKGFQGSCQDSFQKLDTALRQASSTLVPVWHLRDYVAVNPLQGFTSASLLEARGKLRSFSDAEILPSLGFFRDRFQQGFLSREHILEAFEEMEEEEPHWDLSLSEVFEAVMSRGGLIPEATTERNVECVTDIVDRLEDKEWGRFVRTEMGKYCSDYYDEGVAVWQGRHKESSLYAFWRQGCLKDLSCTLSGLSWIKKQVDQLSSNEKVAVLQLIHHLGIPEGYWVPYLSRLVHTLPGWFSWALRMDAQAGAKPGQGTNFMGMLVLRLAYEAGLLRVENLEVAWEGQWISWKHAQEVPGLSGSARDAAIRYVLLRASEVAYRRPLLKLLAERVGRGRGEARPEIEVVFCMDVRSERMRRHLGFADPGIRTSGFAGFFGLAFQLDESAGEGLRPHAPALLNPQLRLKLEGRTGQPSHLAGLLKGTSARVRKSPTGSFGFIETGGWLYLLDMMKRSLGFVKPLEKKECHVNVDQLWEGASGPIPPAQRVDLAEAILEGLGLGAQTGKLFVFCGHESESSNNPLKASLDCGACGGHGGGWNASLAASLLNDPWVRQQLVERGHELPEDTVFAAAVHETVEDQVRILGRDQLPESHQDQVLKLESALISAGEGCRDERAATLGARSGSDLLGRSRDWSEVRPEWGLVGNAALIVGPSEWVRDLDLKGRTFLHDYDAGHDPSGELLEKILGGPMVVAHWINMQYLVSAVDPGHFGSGTKTLHDVCGKFGILSGLEGDLRLGLPQQSVGRGDHPDHDALRLLVAVKASCETLNRVLERQPELLPLCRQGWISLVSVQESGVHRLGRAGNWVSLPMDVRVQEPETGSGQPAWMSC